jgi:hypothetical protein
MKVRLIKETAHFTLRKIYEVVEAKYFDSVYSALREYYLMINDQGIRDAVWADRFEVVVMLPDGWHYCECGATTTNKDNKCCGCKGVV